MPSFRYSAQGSSGPVSGRLQAADRMEAFQLLERQKLRPFLLEAEEGGDSKGASSKQVKTMEAELVGNGQPIKLKLPQILLFTEEISELLDSGIQLEPALATMERRRELSNVKVLASALRNRVREGVSFSKALAFISPSFGNLFCALVAAGEASGALPQILRRQVQYLRSLQALRGKVMFALIYPSFLVATAVGVTVMFVVYLIPKLTQLLDSTGGSLPIGAKIILQLSDTIKATWWIGLLLLLLAWSFLKSWLRKPDNRLRWSAFQLRWPFYGKLIKARFYVQSLETMSNLTGNGLPLIQALQLTKQATENLHLQKQWNPVIAWVGEGVPLSKALARSGGFPDLLLDMISVGEQTGNLAGAMARAADRFDRELTKQIEKMSAMIQPTIVSLMAGLVGAMAYLMITTIFQTISGMGKH